MRSTVNFGSNLITSTANQNLSSLSGMLDICGQILSDPRERLHVPVVQRVDNFFQQIKCISWSTLYLLDGDLYPVDK